MDLRHAAADIALMVLVCVMAMFLHPIAHGPYSAVHGPTTALRAHYRSIVVRISIALAAFSVAALLLPGVAAAALGCRFALFAAFATFAVLSAPDSAPLPLRC